MTQWLSILEISATIIGAIYMYLEYKAKYALWYVGLVWSILYVYLFWEQGMISCAITWIYYFFANVYGIFAWRNEKGETNEPPTHIKKSWIIPFFVITAILMVPLFFLEVIYNPHAGNMWLVFSTVFSTAIGFTGMFLLAKKVVEQWFVWIVVNFIYVVVNLYTGFADSKPTHYFTVLLFATYTVISFLGYVRWKKMAAVADKN
jgi:nicotinamide mononucleotide transporter